MISVVSLRYVGKKNSSDQSRLHDSEQCFSVWMKHNNSINQD